MPAQASFITTAFQLSMLLELLLETTSSAKFKEGVLESFKITYAKTTKQYTISLILFS